MAQHIAPDGQGERVITDEMLALAHSRIGVELPVHAPFNEEATEDSIRHFAHGMGTTIPSIVTPSTPIKRAGAT